jgi:6-phosphogluconolactonase/glucosamine-6-phosphate isomerase/deaminase
MRYILTSGWDDGVADLTDRLVRELGAGNRVLWLVSGGSNIEASLQIMDNISDDLSRRLSVMPADERYGEPGHPDSNWARLMAKGFQPKQAKLLPVLEAGLGLEQTVKHYEQLAEQAFARNDLVIAQLGIGEDGHVAGILPGSPATEATGLISGYDSPPYRRMTLTFPGLQRVRAAYVFAFGPNKQPALQALHDQPMNRTEQPAQILKQLPEAYIYSDQVGEHA